ncbi:MAG: hypothetical protein DSY50_04170, partial [Desulfobulbus sp.]
LACIAIGCTKWYFCSFVTLQVGAKKLQNHRPVTVQECLRLREVLLNSYVVSSTAQSFVSPLYTMLIYTSKTKGLKNLCLK